MIRLESVQVRPQAVSTALMDKVSNVLINQLGGCIIAKEDATAVNGRLSILQSSLLRFFSGLWCI